MVWWKTCHLELWLGCGFQKVWCKGGGRVSSLCHDRWVPVVSCRVLCHPMGGHQLQTRSKNHTPAACVCTTCACKLSASEKQPCIHKVLRPPPADKRGKKRELLFLMPWQWPSTARVSYYSSVYWDQDHYEIYCNPVWFITSNSQLSLIKLV